MLSALVLWQPQATPAVACSQPTVWAVDTAFDLVSNDLLPSSYPHLPPASHIQTIPPSLLKAVGWVESNWRQLTPAGRPLISSDFGYGIMQITSGMAGAFGNPTGSIPPDVQSQIASDFLYNIAYGALILAKKWASVPRIGNGDPTVLENWYYALWAYNGWGWVNNPNNPRFARNGTPASDPASFPYQERVLYLVAHPPRDKDGNPLWPAVPVSLPAPDVIGRTPQHFTPDQVHRQPPPGLGASYQPATLAAVTPGTVQSVPVRITNTGTQPWIANGSSASTLTYHLLTRKGNPWGSLSPFSTGVVAFGQAPAALPHDVLPGQAVVVRAQVTAPTKAGKYRVVWDLQKGVGTWLSQIGALPHAEPLSVVATLPAATPTPTPLANPRPEGLYYIADTSFPDGSAVAPRAHLLKGWLVFNAGREAWGPGWTLQEISGSSFGPRTVSVPVTPACRSVNLVARLRAPRLPGRYSSSWRMHDPTGHGFGDRLTLVLVVSGKAPGPSPTQIASQTTPPTAGKPRPTPTATPTG